MEPVTNTTVEAPTPTAPEAAPAPTTQAPKANSGGKTLEDIGSEAFDALFSEKPETKVEAPDPAKQPESVDEPKKGDDKALSSLSADEQSVLKDFRDGKLDAKTIQDLRDGKIIPKHRLDEVSKGSKAYETLGTPEEISKALARLKDLETKLSNASPADPAKKPELTDEEKEFQNYLDKLYPERNELKEQIKNLQEKLKVHDQDRTKRLEGEKTKWEERNKRAEQSVDKLAKEFGLPVDKEIHARHVRGAVFEIINADPELSKRFYDEGDLGTIQEAFDRHKEIYSGVQRQVRAQILGDKTKQDGLPKRAVERGTPDTVKARDLSKLSTEEKAAAAWEEANAIRTP